MKARDHINQEGHMGREVAVRGGQFVSYHPERNKSWRITPGGTTQEYKSLYVLAETYNLDFGEVRECMTLAEPEVQMSTQVPPLPPAGDSMDDAFGQDEVKGPATVDITEAKLTDGSEGKE